MIASRSLRFSNYLQVGHGYGHSNGILLNEPTLVVTYPLHTILVNEMFSSLLLVVAGLFAASEIYLQSICSCHLGPALYATSWLRKNPQLQKSHS